MKIKKLEWEYNASENIHYTILSLQYPEENCGEIYNGYEIHKLNDNAYQVYLCDIHFGIFDTFDEAKEQAQKHWESIILGAIEQ